MRNGDFSPSRFESQQDAATHIFNTKSRANVESSVGLLSSAGEQYDASGEIRHLIPERPSRDISH